MKRSGVREIATDVDDDANETMNVRARIRCVLFFSHTNIYVFMSNEREVERGR